MVRYFLYMAESAVCLAIFYSAYWLVLRRKTNHRLSRFFLLGAIVLSLLLPLHLVTFDQLRPSLNQGKTATAISGARDNYERLVFSANNKVQPIKQSMGVKPNRSNVVVVSNIDQRANWLQQLSWKDIFLIIYLTGLLALFIRFAVQLMQLFMLIRKSEKQLLDGINYVHVSKDMSPFSFGRNMFVPELVKGNPEYKSIVEHEKAHICQRHSYDLILAELFCAIQWFNPYVWFTRNALKKTHEYLADQQIVRLGYDIYAYQTLLLQHLIYPKSLGLSSAFHFKPLKQRLAMITKIQKPSSLRSRIAKMIPTAVIILLSLAIGIVISCSNQGPKPFDVVTFYGKGSYNNFSTTSIGSVLKADSINPTALLARRGDLISFDDEAFFHRNSTAYTYKFSADHGFLYNNGKVFSIHFRADSAFVPLLAQLDTMDLSELECINIDKGLPESYGIYIEKIASKKPNIGLDLSSLDGEWKNIVSKFQPVWLSLGRISHEEIMQMGDMAQLEMLAISPNNPVIDVKLPAFPKLKHLMLGNMKKGVRINPNFMDNNRNIESFIISDCQIGDFGFLKSLKRLKSLSLVNFDSVVDVAFVKDLPSLTRLSVLGNSILHLNAISEAPNLQWLALSGDIEQGDFDLIISKQPKLEVLELIECDSIKSLKSLAQLRNLYALSITGEGFDSKSVLEVKGLSYLSLPSDALNDDDFAQKVKQAFPNCTIVPNDGFCMGSGWFLLFLPMVLFLACIKRMLRFRFKAKIA